MQTLFQCEAFQDPDKKLVLALYFSKFNLWKKVKIGRTTTGDFNKSAALATFLKRREKSHIFQHHFGNPAPNRD